MIAFRHKDPVWVPRDFIFVFCLFIDYSKLLSSNVSIKDIVYRFVKNATSKPYVFTATLCLKLFEMASDES